MRCDVVGVRDRLAVGAAGHPERLEDVAGHVVLEGLARDTFHEVARKPHAEVVVLVCDTRRPDPLGHRREALGQRLGLAWLGGHRPEQIPLSEPGRVGEQVGGGDRLVERLGDAHIGQVAVDIFVEVEPSLLDLLHHRGRRQQLAHRSDVEPGP